MSCDPFCVLTDEVHDYVALARMQRRRAPRVGIEWDLQAGTHTLSVLVDGQVVVSVTGASLENAARKGLQAWRAWSDDQPASIESALKASVQAVRSDRAEARR